MENNFIQEAEEWLTPFGYSIHSYSADKSCVTFSNVDEEYSPAITCRNINGNRTAELASFEGFKLFLTLKSPELMFKHPDMQRFIDYMRHYSAVCDRNPLR